MNVLKEVFSKKQVEIKEINLKKKTPTNSAARQFYFTSLYVFIPL